MTDFLEMVIGFNWAAYTHEKLYDMVRNEGGGVRAVTDTDEEITEFAALMKESADDVEQALAEAGVSWQGLAADSMGSGVSPLAQWANDAATAGQATGDGNRQIGDSFGYVATAMPEPVPTPSKTMAYPPELADLLEAQTDQDAVEREAQQAKLRAVELMDGYLDNSMGAVSSLGEFVPPQDFAVVTPADTGGSAGSEVGVFEGPGTGGDPGTGDDSPGSGGRDGGPAGGGGPTGGPTGEPSGEPGGSAGSVESPAGTDAARAVPPSAPPVTPMGGSSSPGNVPGTAPPGTFAPVAGLVPRPGTGGVPGSGGAGGGRGPGGVPGGRGAGGAPGGAGRGGLSGTGPLAGEPGSGARGGQAAAGRAGMGPAGFGPMGGAGRRDEDQERTSPEYLRDHRDDFWDDTPPVAPPVLGVDDD